MTGKENEGYPWPKDDPRTPTLLSIPGMPLSWENEEKLRRQNEDFLAWRDFLNHATEAELERAEKMLRKILGK